MNKKNRFYLFIIFVFISLVVYFFSGYFGITETSFWSFVSYNHNLFALVYTLIFIILSTFSFSVTVLIGVGVLFFSKFELFWYAITGVMIKMNNRTYHDSSNSIPNLNFFGMLLLES